MEGIELLHVAAAVVVVKTDRVLGVREEIPAFGLLGGLIVESGHFAVGVLGVDGKQRNGADSVMQGAFVDVTLADSAVLSEGEVEGLAESEDVEVVPLYGHVVGVDAERVTAVLGIYGLDLVVSEDTVLPGIGKTHRELVLGGSAGDVQGVVLGEGTLVVHLLDPVGSLPAAVHYGLVEFGGEN